MLFRFYLLICLCLLITLEGYTQTQPVFQKIDQSQGLSSSRITGIVKEKNGYVWISTQYGLNRYDGFSVKTFNKQNSNIPTNDIGGLFLDSQNRLWLNTYGKGLVFYDKKTSKFTTYKHHPEDKHSIVSNRINTIVEGKNNTLWIGTEKGLNLFKTDENKFYHFNFNHIKPLNIISIYNDDDENIILGTLTSGLFRFDVTYNKLTSIYSEISTSVNEILRFDEDHLLVATSGNGLKLLNLKEDVVSPFKAEHSEFSNRTKIVRSLEKDSQGNLWIGTDGFGLYEIQNIDNDYKIIDNYTQNSNRSFSISGNAIYALTEDEKGNIWIGTAWNGINVLGSNRQTEIIFSDFSGSNPDPILSIAEDKRYLYLGLDGNGLSIYDKLENQSLFYDENLLKAKYIQNILLSDEDELWLGTFNNGLLQLNTKTKRLTKYVNDPKNLNSLSFNDVRDILKDGDSLWVATWGGGLNLLDTKTNSFSRYDISNNNLVSLLKRDNKIWITSYGGGLSVFDIKTKNTETLLYNENDKNTISSNNIFSIAFDHKDKLWIGTTGEGINRLDVKTNKIERFDNVEAIKYKTITSIIQDDSGDMWFGTKSGIVKYDYQSNAFNTFSTLSGDFHINSVYKDEEGYLYFGGLKGVLKFHPKNLKDENKHPKVILNDFKVFNKAIESEDNEILSNSISSADEINLKHFQDVITFEFSALKFPFSNNCEYAIKLENFDRDWRNIGSDRTATYTNLPPGNYIFKVKSRIIGYDWGEGFTSVNVFIAKPFWQSWWAYVFYVLLVLFFLYLYRKITLQWATLRNNLALEKLAHQKDKEFYSLKQQFFTTISHEIRTPVTLILSSINRLFDSDELQNSKQFKAAHTIRRNSNLLLRLINELLDVKKLESKEIVLNTTENDIVNFTRDIYLSFSDVANDRNINYKFKSNVEKENIRFDKAQLEKVIFNLLSNAFKFTKDKGHITVEIIDNPESVSILIKDDGIGISKEHINRIFSKYYQVKGNDAHKGFGLGLSIAKDIVDLHKGNINVVSELNKGSLFEITLLKDKPLIKAKNKPSEALNNGDPNTEELKQKLKTSQKKNLRVLIVEDNAELREALKDLFKDNNYDVILA
jgi:signal transduction histidine kinase/ligand-binding sensor domain-containing protein